MKGRKPKPLYLKALDGNTGHRAKRPSPKPCIELSLPPSHLSDAARREYERLSDTCHWLTGADSGVVEAAAVQFALWRQALEVLERDGLCYKANDLTKTHPAFRVASQAVALYLRACSELGASPVSRARVDGGETSVTDELEDWQKGN